MLDFGDYRCHYILSPRHPTVHTSKSGPIRGSGRPRQLQQPHTRSLKPEIVLTITLKSKTLLNPSLTPLATMAM